MRIVSLLRPAIFLCLGIAGHAADFKWADRGTISFEVPTGWKLEGHLGEDGSYLVLAKPETKLVALLQISVVAMPPNKPVSVRDLPERLQESLLPYIEESVEKEFRPVALKSQQGHGWYAELTDASLVGKPPVPDNFKVMRSALVALDRQTLMVATMQLDNPVGDEAGEMLAIVCSVRFTPGPK